MKITREEKERGEKAWRRYKRQKYSNVIKNILLCLMIIFAAVIFFCVLVLHFFKKQSTDALEVIIKPLTLEGIIFASLIFMISAAIMYLWLLLQKQENFQWFCFCFIRKEDFTPYKYYALCIYNGRFIVCKVFLQTLCKTWKINLDTLIEIDLTTSQRRKGFYKDDIYKGILKVKLGFKEEEITVSLLESIFADVDAFVAETKEVIAKAIKIPLQNLGWEEGARIEPEKIQKACSGIVAVVRGVCLYIEHASTPKNVAHAYIFHRRRKSNGDVSTRKKIEEGLREVVRLARKEEARAAARESQ